MPPTRVCFVPDPGRAGDVFMTAATTVRMSAAAVVSLNTQMEVPALRQTKARSKRHTEFETYQAECEAKAAAGRMAAMHTSGGNGADDHGSSDNDSNGNNGGGGGGGGGGGNGNRTLASFRNPIQTTGPNVT